MLPVTSDFTREVDTAFSYILRLAFWHLRGRAADTRPALPQMQEILLHLQAFEVECMFFSSLCLIFRRASLCKPGEMVIAVWRLTEEKRHAILTVGRNAYRSILREEIQMEKKILFFDIDGTLLDRENRVPESAVRALRLAGERGHLRFLCTGRTASMLPPQVTELGFDGIVGGAGTYVRSGKDILLYRELTLQEVTESLKWLAGGKFGFLYEGKDCVHVMPWEHYPDPERYQNHIRRIGAPCEVIDTAHPEKIHTSKFSGSVPPEQWDYCRRMIEALRDSFHVVIHQPPAAKGSSLALTEGLVEFLPIGCDKGTGIRKVLEYLEIPLENVYAFGDSNNDLEMLRLVPHSICMGNGTADAMEAAEYVTTDMNQDGIWNAMRYYGLIEC